jgi:hypothetical protein
VFAELRMCLRNIFVVNYGQKHGHRDGNCPGNGNRHRLGHGPYLLKKSIRARCLTKVNEASAITGAWN